VRFERLLAKAHGIFLATLALSVFPVALPAAAGSPSAPAAADIELRKTFRSDPRARSGNFQPSTRPYAANTPPATVEADGSTPPRIVAAAAALGEQLQSSGTLFLPGVGERGLVLPGSTAPVLEIANGRHLIIDANRAIAPELAAEIERVWPGFSVLQPPADADLREVIGSLLDAAGYDSVLRAAPVTFGRDVSIRLAPDFVVLRSERDLLEGETRAISVVDRADALPAELRELADDFRVRIVELTGDGAPAGPERAAWRDATGRVTTMESARLAPVLGEIALDLGLEIEQSKAVPSVLASCTDLPEAIGNLLENFGVPAIGPTVEFYRAHPAGSTPRFVISVPGWLVEPEGRKLLITGASLPSLVRLYLTRQGIDIFEYRIRDGRCDGSR